MKIIQIVVMEKEIYFAKKTMTRTLIYGLSDEGVLYERATIRDKENENTDSQKSEYKWKLVLTSEDILNEE